MPNAAISAFEDGDGLSALLRPLREVPGLGNYADSTDCFVRALLFASSLQARQDRPRCPGQTGLIPFKKRVGVVTTNGSPGTIATSSTSGGDKKVKLTAIFSPEHGYMGVVADAAVLSVASTKDPATGVPVYSLLQGESYAGAGDGRTSRCCCSTFRTSARASIRTRRRLYVLRAAAEDSAPSTDRPN